MYLRFLLFLSVAFFSEASRLLPAQPKQRDAVVPSWFSGIHGKVSGFVSEYDDSSYYGDTDTGRLVCTPLNCPTSSGLCGLIYINLEPQPPPPPASPSDQNNNQKMAMTLAMEPSHY